MAKLRTPLETKLLAALKQISLFLPSDQVRRVAVTQYGIDADTAIDLAYDNVLGIARDAMRGTRAKRDA